MRSCTVTAIGTEYAHLMSLRQLFLCALAAFVTIAVSGTARGEVRLAVPAFENLTGDQRLDWIGEGFSRTLIEKLNSVAAISVAGVKARGLFSPSREIDFAKLIGETGPGGVDVVILGAILKGADVDHLDEPLAITLRVVDLRTTRQSGALEIVGRMREMFSMEADLAAQAAALCGVRLSPAEEEALRTQETRSLQAYKETVLGTSYLEDGKFDPAIVMFEQAMTHHSGIFYPKAHTLLAEAYVRSGKKEEMLRRMKKDAASLAGVYYQLAVAQEFNGQPEEAAKNFALFLKYTDRRTLHWKQEIPSGLQVRGVDDHRIWLKVSSGAERFLVLSLDGVGGVIEASAGDASPIVSAQEFTATAVPMNERGRVKTQVLEVGGRIYYGLNNGFLVGRDAHDGSRVWAYRIAGTPAGALAYAGGTLIAQDDRGTFYRLGLYEGGEPSDVTAYLHLANLARRREQTADAEGIYRHIVEKVKPNVPEAWHGLWELARDAGNAPAAREAWQRYEESQF